MPSALNRCHLKDPNSGGRKPGTPELHKGPTSDSQRLSLLGLRGDSVSNGQDFGTPELRQDEVRWVISSIIHSCSLTVLQTKAVSHAMVKDARPFLAGLLVNVALSLAGLVIMYVISDGFSSVITTSIRTVCRVAVHLTIYVLRRGNCLLSSLTTTMDVVCCAFEEWCVAIQDAMAAALDEVDM